MPARHLMEITAQNEEFIRNVNTGVWNISFLFADRGTTPGSFPGWYGNRAILVNLFTNLTFCLLVSWTMFQQHQPTHEVSEPNALLRCSKCTDYGLPKQQSRMTNTHNGWSSLSTQHYNQMYKQLDLCHPLFHYLQYEWWPKYCIMWTSRAEGRWSVRRLQQSPSTSVYLVPSTIPSNPPGLHIVHAQ